jgi:hypothetical protein
MTTPENPAQPPPPPPPQPEPGPGYGTGQYTQSQPGYAPPPPPPPSYGYAPMPGAPAYAQYARPTGPLGELRPTGMTILLFFVTLGIWGLIYYYRVHEEMKRHSGEGLGGVVALVLAIFVGVVSPYLLSHEVGQLYERSGRQKPVSAVTGLWFFPGLLILVGPFIWFVQTNNALNDYWRSMGQVDRGVLI